MDLYHELKKLVSALRARKIPYALCGGLALAVHGIPRSTIDIDLMVEKKTLGEAREIARGLGFTVDTGVMRMKKRAIQIYRLVKPDPAAGDMLILDLILVTPRLRDAWDTREIRDSEFGPISVVSKKGLITLKAFRNNGRDREEIRALEERHDET